MLPWATLRRTQKMGKNQIEREDKIEFSGIILDTMPGPIFRVKCESGQEIVATLSGKLRQNKIKLLIGDLVKVEVSPYDTSKGRVTWRK